MAFLDKANRDPSEGYAQNTTTSAGGPFKTTDAGVAVPKALKEATTDAFYTSDADEPFEAVALKWDESGKGLPDEGTYPAPFVVMMLQGGGGGFPWGGGGEGGGWVVRCVAGGGGGFP